MINNSRLSFGISCTIEITDTRSSMNLEQAIQNALGVAPTKHPGFGKVDKLKIPLHSTL